MAADYFFDDDNIGKYRSSDEYRVYSETNNPSWISMEDDFEKPFEQMITYMLGSDLHQDIKDEFINKCLPLKEFRSYVKEYFPKYENKIKLWETLHGITPNS